MAKRGRPKTIGESGSVRVPRDLYVMIQWVADAMKVSTTRVADRFLRGVVAELYVQLLPEIRRRYSAELKSAEMEGREPLPLADLRVFVMSQYTDENGDKKHIDPTAVHPERKRAFYVSELSDDALEKVAGLGVLLPEDLRLARPRPEDLLDNTPGSGFDVGLPLERPGYDPKKLKSGESATSTAPPDLSGLPSPAKEVRKQPRKKPRKKG